MTDIPYYWRSVDWDRLIQDYPPPPLYVESHGQLGDDELRAMQQERALARVDDAWRTRFYRSRWTDAGIEPGDITSLEDVAALPTFTSADLKDAMETAPPFGSHHPFGRDELGTVPLKIQTSGGTTGTPRVTVFDPIAWEVQAIQCARAFYEQGARPGDIVQIPMTTSLANAPWMAFTAAFNWLGCVPLTTGSGVVTPTERQIEYAQLFGTNVWYGFPEYLGRVVEVAEERGIDVTAWPTKFVHTYLGVDPGGVLRAQLEKAWGAPVYDNYGTHEIGLIAYECRMKNLMHVFEDTALVQVIDEDSGSPVDLGQPGDLVVTSLHRSIPPLIRFNMRDRLALHPRNECACGVRSHRLSGFLGRSDDMVKLRGTNIYPMACLKTILEDSRANGEFLCVMTASGSGSQRREEMTVRVECGQASADREAMRSDLENALRRDLGARVAVEIVDPGTLADHTRVGKEGKARRLLDLRGES